MTGNRVTVEVTNVFAKVILDGNLVRKYDTFETSIESGRQKAEAYADGLRDGLRWGK